MQALYPIWCMLTVLSCAATHQSETKPAGCLLEAAMNNPSAQQGPGAITCGKKLL